MKRINISVILCSIALLSVSSCVKENPYIGNAIRFSAATEFQNGVETRTEYSNTEVTVSGNKFERINWISGDDINILYKHGNNSSSAIYNIASITNPSDNETDLQKKKKSTATVSLATGILGNSALEWADGTPVFYAVYPATVSSGTAPSVSASGDVSNLSVPATQTVTWDGTSKYQPDMRNAYMVSYASSGQISGDAVTLPFSPAVTALDFKLKLNENKASQAVKQVHLQSSTSALAGSYTVTISGFSNDAVTWSASSSSTTKGITVNFKNGNNSSYEPAMSYGSYLDFTIFVLPTSGITNLSLLIKYHDDTVKTLSLSGLTLTPGRKYKITNDKVPNLDYDYYITPISPITLAAGHSGGSQAITIESYKQDKTDATNQKPVPWKLQYTTDNGNNWTDLPSGGYGGFTASMLSHNTGGVPGSGQSSTITLGTTSNSETHIDPDGLNNVTSVGSSSAPIDLSLNGSANTHNTANCYVVNGPGYYMFPCVYGNAIKNNAVNDSAFRPKQATDGVTETNTSVSQLGGISNNQPVANTVYKNYALKTDGVDIYWAPEFRNVNAGFISNASVVTDLNLSSSGWEPVVVWQDVPQDDEIIPYGNASYIGKTTASIGSTTYDYIWFRIDADKIKPGNIVIAMNVPGDTRILWSWHIWIPESAVGYSGSFLNKNLGEVSQTKVTKYEDRSLKFRIVQTDGSGNILTGGASKEFVFSQNGDSSSSSPVTRNTYYQWGRKDPMLNTNANTDVSINPNLNITRANSFTAFQGFDATSVDYGRSIRGLNLLLQNSKSRSWMDGDVYPNFSSVTTTTTTTYTITNQRTSFPVTQASNLNSTSFSVTTDWDTEYAAGWYVDTNKSIKQQSYTTEQIEWLIHPYYLPPGTYYSTITGWFNLGVYAYADAQNTNGFTWYDNPYYCLPASDFTAIGNGNWKYTGSKRGPFTAAQAIYLAQIGYSGGTNSAINNNQAVDMDYWDYYAVDQVVFIGTYKTGPYEQWEYDIMIQNGFVSGDFSSNTTTSVVSTPYATPEQRGQSSIVYNLWNAYIYTQSTAGAPYTNKFKTIYDPCPPGYTVPTVSIINNGTSTAWNADNYPTVGALPTVSSNWDVSGYTYNVNGYWTDQPLRIKPTGANVDLTQLSNFQDYDKAYMNVVSGGTVSQLRSTAASVRPMVDPKLTGVASSVSRASLASPNAIEGVTFGSEL